MLQPVVWLPAPLFLKPGMALSFTIILHLAITMWGMYKLVYRWLEKAEVQEVNSKSQFSPHQAALLGSIVWVLSTQMTVGINNISVIQSLSWFPWVVWAGLRVGNLAENLVKNKKNNFLAHFWWPSVHFSLLILLQFLAGYPQHIIYSIFAAVLFSLFKFWQAEKKIFFSRFLWWLKHWLFTAVIMVLLSAVVWLPFVELFMESTRMLQSADQALVGSLHPAMLVKIFLPYFFENYALGMRWGSVWSGQTSSIFYITWLGLFIIARSFFIKNSSKQFKLKIKMQQRFFLSLVLCVWIRNYR